VLCTSNETVVFLLAAFAAGVSAVDAITNDKNSATDFTALLSWV